MGFKDVFIEKNLCGKRIDVFAIYQEMKIAIEICISTIQTEYINVLKDMDKCDFIFIVTPDKKTKQKLENTIYRKISRDSKINICLVHEVLNSNYVLEVLNKPSDIFINL